MKIIKLKLKDSSYDIAVGFNIIHNLSRYINKLKIGRDAYVITNTKIKGRFGSILNQALKIKGFRVKFKVVPDTEKSKSIETASSVIRDLARYDRSKRIFIVAFGGGVIGDLAGFVASIYKRGIPYIQIPTTLLAQVDSSIGGKTAIDLREGKNLVGAFYQPKLVISEVRFLNTLSQRQVRSGLAEVIKYGIIKDRQLLNYLEKRYKDILKLNPGALAHIVERSSRIKADIVHRDEREKKMVRTILNFGHTVGHAIEAASGYNVYNHGEAVALGMLVATDISRRLSLINNHTASRIENLIKAVGLPVSIKRVTLPRIINAHYHDKKFIGARNRFVLIKTIGKTKIVEDIPLEIIKEAIRKRI